MKFSAQSTYAIEALLYLALNPGRRITVGELSEQCEISKPFLVKISFWLRRAGIVFAEQGAAGGFMLAKKPEEITISQVLAALGESPSFVPCVKDLSRCRSGIRDRCVTRSLWEQVTQRIDSQFDEISIGALAQQYAQEEAK